MALHALVLLAVLAAVSACEEKPVHSPVAPSTTTSAPGPQQIPAATRIIRFSGDIDFGGVELGNMPAKPFSVCNDGNASLAIMGIEVPNGYWFVFDDWDTAQGVPAGICRGGIVGFQPLAPGNYTGVATATSNSTAGTSTFQISGTGSHPPQPRTTFGEGRFLVGIGIAPGRYYSDPGGECYWTRKSTYPATPGDDIARVWSGFDPGQWVVDILPSDAVFETEGCGSWSQRPVRVRDSKVIAPGMWDVRAQVPKGRYRADAQPGCFWQRLRNFEGTPGGVIEAGSADRSIPITVSIQSGDAGFHAGPACGRWYWNE